MAKAKKSAAGKIQLALPVRYAYHKQATAPTMANVSGTSVVTSEV